MPAAPRLRQIRRDPTIYSLLMNAVRLDLEEDERLERQPTLQAVPDDTLLALRRSRQQWLVLAAAYVLRRAAGGAANPAGAGRVVRRSRPHRGAGRAAGQGAPGAAGAAAPRPAPTRRP